MKIIFMTTIYFNNTCNKNTFNSIFNAGNQILIQHQLINTLFELTRTSSSFLHTHVCCYLAACSYFSLYPLVFLIGFRCLSFSFTLIAEGAWSHSCFFLKQVDRRSLPNGKCPLWFSLMSGEEPRVLTWYSTVIYLVAWSSKCDPLRENRTL